MVCTNVFSLCADSRFAEPRYSLKKVLIVAVRSCGCGVLIRGLQNLDAPCKGDVFTFFLRRAKRTKKHARTCKKLPVASFCASETAETGRIANGREQKRPFPSGKPSRFCKPRWQLAAAAASCPSEKLEKVFDPRGKFAYVAQRLSAIGKRITVHTLGVKPDLLCNI